MNTKLILANITDSSKYLSIQKLCRKQNISVKKLQQTDINEDIATLAGINKNIFAGLEIPAKIKAPLFYILPEIIIFYGFSSSDLDMFLDEYKREKISPVELKAIVTAENMYWSLYGLIKELEQERKAMRENSAK